MAVRRPTTTATPSRPEAAPGDAGRPPGLAPDVTVKGVPASAAQRRVIEGCLAEAERLGCSRRVMVAVVMCITQESTAMSLGYGDRAGPDSRGPYQQRAPWGPLAQRLDPAGATRLFLTVNRGPGVQGWQVVHGSLKNAPGSLSRAINRVQLSAFPDAYARWEAEATRTVAGYTGGSGASGGPAQGRYEFTRGQRGGERESSWDASGRLAEEVGWRRWAAGNRFFFVSEDELRRGAPSLVMRGDEPWLVTGPSWDWASSRPVSEVALQVLRSEWGVAAGGVVVLTGQGPLDGRWIVGSVRSGSVTSPVLDVALRRPVLPGPEPAADTGTTTTTEAGTPGRASGPGPTAGVGSLIGRPFSGTHTLGDWQSDRAVDIALPFGSAVYAVQAGRVTKAGGSSSFTGRFGGLNMTITSDGDRFYYAHLSSRDVGVGASVQAGQRVGRSGKANGVDHLHWAVERGDVLRLAGIG